MVRHIVYFLSNMQHINVKFRIYIYFFFSFTRKIFVYMYIYMLHTQGHLIIMLDLTLET